MDIPYGTRGCYIKKLYLIGGGGHCCSCIDVIESDGRFSIQGIFDLPENIGKKILNYRIVGSDFDLEKFNANDVFFLITLGQIKSADLRLKIYEKLKGLNANIANVISPRAYVSKYAIIGEGTIVMHDALVNANSKIGANCILNTKSLVEHDVVVGSHCHISTGSVINGNCVVGDEVFVGSNSVIKHGIVIKNKAIIQAGSFIGG